MPGTPGPWPATRPDRPSCWPGQRNPLPRDDRPPRCSARRCVRRRIQTHPPWRPDAEPVLGPWPGVWATPRRRVHPPSSARAQGDRSPALSWPAWRLRPLQPRPTPPTTQPRTNGTQRQHPVARTPVPRRDGVGVSKRETAHARRHRFTIQAARNGVAKRCRSSSDHSCSVGASSIPGRQVGKRLRLRAQPGLRPPVPDHRAVLRYVTIPPLPAHVPASRPRCYGRHRFCRPCGNRICRDQRAHADGPPRHAHLPFHRPLHQPGGRNGRSHRGGAVAGWPAEDRSELDGGADFVAAGLIAGMVDRQPTSPRSTGSAPRARPRS